MQKVGGRSGELLRHTIYHIFVLFGWGKSVSFGDETMLGQLAEDQIINNLRSLVRSFLAISIPALRFGGRGFISTMQPFKLAKE